MQPKRTEHPWSNEVVKATPFDWRDDGVLWLINATVFHPRGFSLGMKADGREPILLGNGREPLTFDPDDEPTPAAKFAAVEALFERARQAAPNPALGGLP